jgi:hypothetical protein
MTRSRFGAYVDICIANPLVDDRKLRKTLNPSGMQDDGNPSALAHKASSHEAVSMLSVPMFLFVWPPSFIDEDRVPVSALQLHKKNFKIFIRLKSSCVFGDHYKIQ